MDFSTSNISNSIKTKLNTLNNQSPDNGSVKQVPIRPDKNPFSVVPQEAGVSEKIPVSAEESTTPPDLPPWAVSAEELFGGNPGDPLPPSGGEHDHGHDGSVGISNEVFQLRVRDFFERMIIPASTEESTTPPAFSPGAIILEELLRDGDPLPPSGGQHDHGHDGSVGISNEVFQLRVRDFFERMILPVSTEESTTPPAFSPGAIILEKLLRDGDPLPPSGGEHDHGHDGSVGISNEVLLLRIRDFFERMIIPASTEGSTTSPDLPLTAEDLDGFNPREHVHPLNMSKEEFWDFLEKVTERTLEKTSASTEESTTPPNHRPPSLG